MSVRIIPAAVLSLLLVACGSASDKNKAEPPPVPATVVTLAPQAWSDQVEALGTAQANESITLNAKITETVRKVNFTDGQKVDAGDILVELTSGQQAAQLEEAQATYKDAERQYARQEGLVQQGTVSKALFETSQATRDSSRAHMDAIRAQLADRVITAPFAGVLGLRHVSPGTLVTPGTAITTLDDIHVMKLDFAVPETAIAALKAGQSVQTRAAAYPDKHFDGKIESLDSRVDPATRALTVRALIPNPEGLLRPGMLLSVSVTARERQSLGVPELALVPLGGKQYVYRVGAGNAVEQVEVKLGARRAGEVEVTSGLAEGDRVVVEGTVSLRAGAKVAIKEDKHAGGGEAAVGSR